MMRPISHTQPHIRLLRPLALSLLLIGSPLYAAESAQERPVTAEAGDEDSSSPLEVLPKLATNALTLSLGGMWVGDTERFLQKATHTMPLIATARSGAIGIGTAVGAFFSSLLERE